MGGMGMGMGMGMEMEMEMGMGMGIIYLRFNAIGSMQRKGMAWE